MTYLSTIPSSIADIPISIGRYDDYVNDIINLASGSVSSYVCVMNAHMLVEAYFNDSFKSVIQNADIVTPDGVPLTWALRLTKRVKQERVAGMDLLPTLLEKCEINQLSVFFYGGTSDMLVRTERHVQQYFPDLKVAGYQSPPFRELLKSEEDKIVDDINSSKVNIVFVALGCPKQEKWMALMKGRINATMVGIGGALPVIIGLQKRAPVWMQEVGMEWFYRLYLEPRRLFKRYAITNTVFLYLLVKEMGMKKIGRLKQKLRTANKIYTEIP